LARANSWNATYFYPSRNHREFYSRTKASADFFYEEGLVTKVPQILLSYEVNPKIPVLLVDLSDEDIWEKDETYSHAMTITMNLARLQESNQLKIYTTHSGKDLPFVNILDHQKLPFWFSKGRLNPDFLQNIRETKIQLCGLYRELCLFQLAALLLKADKTPIVIDSDHYSVPAHELSIIETPEISIENRILSGEAVRIKTASKLSRTKEVQK
jgi:hypothetical protein